MNIHNGFLSFQISDVKDKATMETTSAMTLVNSSKLPNITAGLTTQASSLSPASDWSYIQDNFYVAGYVVTPTILLVGLFGNTMTILTVSSKSFSDLTSRLILIALAISDTTLIALQPFNKLFVRKLIGYDVRALSAGGCKFFFWLFRTAKMTSSWLIVILCFERFVAVVFPLKTRSIINKTTILVLIVSDYVIVGIFNGVWAFSSIIEDGICKPDVVYPDTKLKYRNYLLAGLSLYSFIPMLAMIIFTPIIVWKLLQKWKKRQFTQQNGKRTSKKDAKELRASLVLVVVVAAFIVFVLPITIVFCLAYWQSVSAFETNTLGFFVFRELAQILEQLNYSINFFLYIMCSDMFRRRTLQILRRPCKGSKVSPSGGASDMCNSSTNQVATNTRTNLDTFTSQNRVSDYKATTSLPTVSI